ncbi:hypothetical protein JZ751_004490 [Albula glossodonta]|uniref:Ig-like domain-containing protein n=1 Tax=Albula glossodonta TaxID=121402 RepID=A0A8T2MU33_9TELE|nr:hypothetical protein JZ751_004490 [Albula glossodonta]
MKKKNWAGRIIPQAYETSQTTNFPKKGVKKSFAWSSLASLATLAALATLTHFTASPFLIALLLAHGHGFQMHSCTDCVCGRRGHPGSSTCMCLEFLPITCQTDSFAKALRRGVFSLHLKVVRVASSRLWREATCVSLSVSAPDRVSALLGSCVVIPCSFSAGPSWPRGVQYQVRLRYQTSIFNLRSTVFSSEDRSPVHRDFIGRTELAGDPSRGDCSVRINEVTMDDHHIYEVGVKEQGAAEWRKSQKILLDVSYNPQKPVISDPGAVIEGQLVILNCTVQWRWERGSQENSTSYQAMRPVITQGPEQLIISSIYFIASSLAQPKVRCEARFPGGRTVSVTKELHVRDVVVHVNTLTVQEGASVLLSCSCKADPPVSEFQWWYSQEGRTVNLPQRTHSVRLYNVTRDLRVNCVAQNRLGKAESSPTAINVQYKPAISPQSLCQWQSGIVSCRCTVDGNPRPAVTWSINGSSPPDGYNTSVSAGDGMLSLSVTLRGDMDELQGVVCYAYNALGNDSSTLLYTSDDSLLWKLFPALCVLSSLSLLVPLLVILHCCRRKSGKPSSVYPGNLGIYQERMPLYINCTEVTHIYTNGSYQLVYQNCTPLFVRSKQVLQREKRVAWTDRRTQRERRAPEAETEIPVYLEIM